MVDPLHTIALKIVTPERVVYESDVTEITMPTESGEIAVMPNHQPLVTLLVTGEIRLRKPDQAEVVPFAVSSGIVEVRESFMDQGVRTEVIILAFRSELASEIDIARAEEAHARALKMVQEKEFESDVDFAKFQAMIDKELNRIEIYRKWRK
jgi:F-type H+-transporting ATPase subunit epsilon